MVETFLEVVTFGLSEKWSILFPRSCTHQIRTRCQRPRVRAAAPRRGPSGAGVRGGRGAGKGCAAEGPREGRCRRGVLLLRMDSGDKENKKEGELFSSDGLK